MRNKTFPLYVMDCITHNAPSLLQQENHSNAHFTSIMQILPS